jgi:iron(III) transport system substrate-binding protein
MARLKKIVLFVAIVVWSSCFEDSTLAQRVKPLELSELVAYTGADREQILVAGAKAEGKVVWYTSLAGSSYRELAQGFEKKYPGVKVDVYRAASNELMAKIAAEANARQHR